MQVASGRLLRNSQFAIFKSDSGKNRFFDAKAQRKRKVSQRDAEKVTPCAQFSLRFFASLRLCVKIPTLAQHEIVILTVDAHDHTLFRAWLHADVYFNLWIPLLIGFDGFRNYARSAKAQSHRLPRPPRPPRHLQQPHRPQHPKSAKRAIHLHNRSVDAAESSKP